jgi:hypothetical protein
MMKIRTVLLIVAAVFAASNATAEPFNEGGVHYVYEAPTGSYQVQQPVNTRSQDYATAPAGSNKPGSYADSQSKGFAQQGNYASGSYQYKAAGGWNN